MQSQLAGEMEEASEAMEFERAAALRDRIRALTQVQIAQGINPRGVAEADVIALHMEGGQACVQVFFIRANQNWGNRDYYPRTGAGAEAAEVLEAFIGQFYDTREPPRLMLLSHEIEDRDLMAEALSREGGPQGRDHRCRSAARRRSWSRARRATPARAWRGGWPRGRRRASCWTALAEAFGLDAPPQRIEVYDN